MKSFSSIKDFLAHLALVEAELHRAERTGEEAAGEMLVTRAKAMIGSEANEWPALTADTVAEKERLGFTGRISPTDPLYRTGELRLSISYRVDQSGLLLGSTDPIAPFHEEGTSRMPPRPFIGATVFRHGHEAADTIAEHVVALVGDDPPPRRRP